MIYNVRVNNYKNGDEVVRYTHGFIRGTDSRCPESFTKGFQNENRTEEEAAHCLAVSLNKTKHTVYNIVRSNDWEYFVTLTFDQKRYDSSDYDRVISLFTYFFHELKKKNKSIGYIFIPELHSDGEHYHFHGLLKNSGGCKIVPSGKFLLDGKIVSSFRRGCDVIYNWMDWKYGFTSLTAVKSQQRVTSYITKYITKQNGASVIKNKKRYYCSTNLARAKTDYLFSEENELDFLKNNVENISHVSSREPSKGLCINYYQMSANGGKEYGKISVADRALQNRVPADPKNVGWKHCEEPWQVSQHNQE